MDNRSRGRKKKKTSERIIRNFFFLMFKFLKVNALQSFENDLLISVFTVSAPPRRDRRSVR